MGRVSGSVGNHEGHLMNDYRREVVFLAKIKWSMRTNLKKILPLALVAALACCGCIDISGNTPPSSNTTCTTTDNGSGAPPTSTCTTQPTGGSHWGFFL